MAINEIMKKMQEIDGPPSEVEHMKNQQPLFAGHTIGIATRSDYRRDSG